MPLLSLPNEILFEIASNLPYYHSHDRPTFLALYSLIRVNRFLHTLLSPYLISCVEPTDLLIWAIDHDRTDTVMRAISLGSRQGLTLNTSLDTHVYRAGRICGNVFGSATEFATRRCIDVAEDFGMNVLSTPERACATLKFVFDAGGTPTRGGMGEAICYGNMRLVRLHLEHGMRVDDGSPDGYFLLCAAASGHVNIVKLLLEEGADPNYSYQSRAGEIIPVLLHAIRSQADANMLKTLLDAGADATWEDINGTSMAGALIMDDGCDIEESMKLLAHYGSRVPI